MRKNGEENAEEMLLVHITKRCYDISRISHASIQTLKVASWWFENLLSCYGCCI